MSDPEDVDDRELVLEAIDYLLQMRTLTAEHRQELLDLRRRVSPSGNHVHLRIEP